MRPCRFAGPASATRQTLAGQAVLLLDGVADGEDVRVAGAHWSSTRMPPRSPTSMPAISASAVSGFTPMPRITMSAG